MDLAGLVYSANGSAQDILSGVQIEFSNDTFAFSLEPWQAQLFYLDNQSPEN